MRRAKELCICATPGSRVRCSLGGLGGALGGDALPIGTPDLAPAADAPAQAAVPTNPF